MVSHLIKPVSFTRFNYVRLRNFLIYPFYCHPEPCCICRRTNLYTCQLDYRKIATMYGEGIPIHPYLLGPHTFRLILFPQALPTMPSKAVSASSSAKPPNFSPKCNPALAHQLQLAALPALQNPHSPPPKTAIAATSPQRNRASLARQTPHHVRRRVTRSSAAA